MFFVMEYGYAALSFKLLITINNLFLMPCLHILTDINKHIFLDILRYLIQIQQKYADYLFNNALNIIIKVIFAKQILFIREGKHGSLTGIDLRLTTPQTGTNTIGLWLQ